MKKDKKRGLEIDRKAQLTIFVIIAVLIVASIVLVFGLTRSSTTPKISAYDDPGRFIRSCAEESTYQAEKLLLEHTGFINPSGNSFTDFNQVPIAWMCYTSSYDDICTNKHPMLRAEIEKELYNYVKPTVDKCFAQMKNELSRYGYNDETQLNMSVQIVPRLIKSIIPLFS